MFVLWNNFSKTLLFKKPLQMDRFVCLLFETGSHYSWSSLCKPGWPQIHRVALAFASQMAGIKSARHDVRLLVDINFSLYVSSSFCGRKTANAGRHIVFFPASRLLVSVSSKVYGRHLPFSVTQHKVEVLT